MHSCDFTNSAPMETSEVSRLRELLAGERLPLCESLALALALARRLDGIHREGAAHLTISLDTVFWDRASRTLRIADASSSRESAGMSLDAGRSDRHTGDLECMAPELSGRLHVAIDERVDLYALGAVMYRLLAGGPLFEASDALGWLHAHLAQVPRPLHVLDPTIPQTVSELVARLLAKMPQQRYQSAWGVQADLARCLAQLESSGEVVPFELGRDDVCPHILEPRRLYGREASLRQMESALEAARCGGVQALMLRGPAGAGKSALVQALRQSASAARLQLASSKVDQFKRHVPYASLVQAFESLVVQRPASSPPDWAALMGGNLPFLQVLAPAIVSLHETAAQPLPAGMSSAETRARFAKAGTEFVRLHASAEAPLVLFLDDLQWVDLATLELLEHLLLQEDLEHLLFIGACRDDEVDANHPLTHMLARLNEARRPVVDLPLIALTEDDLVAWLADSLHVESREAMPLARILISKTLGNPFFVQRFLEYAHQHDLLSFDRKQRAWTWRADALRDSEVMGDVVALLLSQLEVLDSADRRALAECAVIGTRFDPADVAELTGADPVSLAQMIARACRHGFVRADGPVHFAFAHDRVQEAASLDLDAGARRELHARLGRHLRARLDDLDVDNAVFEVVRHLSHAVDAASPAPQRQELMQLAFRAARRARLSGAPAEGLRFAQTAIACADESIWQSNAATAQALYTEAQTLAFLSSEHDRAQAWFERLQAQPGEPIAKVESRAVMVEQLTMQGRYQQAMELALKSFAELGLVIDLDNVFDDMASELATYEAHLARTGSEALLARPSRPDARVEAIVTLTRRTLPVAFFANPSLCPLLGLRVANLCIESQMLRGTGYTFSMICFAYIGLRGDYRSGAATAEFALRSSVLGNDQVGVAENSHILGLIASPWVAPLEQTLIHARNGLRLLTETGCLQLAGYTFFEALAARFERGEALPLVEQEVAAAFAFTGKTKNQHAEQSYLAYRQLLRALRGQTHGAGKFDDDGFSEVGHLLQLGENQMARCYFHIHKLVLASYVDDQAAALEHATASAPLLPFITGFLTVGTFHFHAALAWCNAIRGGHADNPATLHAQLEASTELLMQWAESAPSTFAHRAALVRAERSALASEPLHAMQLYEQAIAQAQASGFVHEEGLACQRAARFYEAIGLRQQSRAMLQAAQRCFARWGASALLPTTVRDAAEGSASRSEPGLDLDSVLKSAEAIGGELAYAELVKKLVAVALENAGAQRAILMCQGPDGRQLPEAWVETSPAGLRVFGSYDGAIPFEVPAVMLRAVQKERTPLSIDDAANDPRSYTDAVVRERGIQSALVLPLMRQQAMIGLLYLENNLAAGLFTDPRVRVLRVIAGQAAVALESARLFGDLERQVALRTRELELRNLDLAREVREREAAQIELQAAQCELAEAAKMAALGGLVAGVAHEINTPVGLGLTGASHFRYMVDRIEAKFLAGELEEADFERFVAEAKELSRSIFVSLEKAAELVSSFKLVAVDQSSDNRRSFAMRAYIEDVVLTHQSVLRRAHATLTLDCEPGLVVESFPGAWSQMLSNLIGNSLTHAFDGARDDARIEVRVIDRPEEVVLSYRDNGRGMSEEVAKKVFDPFFTTNRQGGGSGLGMHIVYNIVAQQLRGRIRLETAPGQGVNFTINVPKQTATVADRSLAE